ncbi:pyridoxal phosphate-dependent decarboxylase family protein [Saccharothrix longispora]|uniref:Glutamate/tyrosine decarboxylase-like PLP-dependent enzyme n=1 Tax=Saccharothrix longispora TaxID=33920 RepID=A0ABU1PMK0_9PSEU|nr:aminotransferase class V-fold PLP-dependent enzyme [Saccharothrix longispora]MDR6591840.1 glutamate/tyrosine decarboxylase-like PLP-dependent enzyme [Saccharothrix longispora]
MTNIERAPLDLAYRQAVDYLTGLRERPVGATAGLDELIELLGGPMPENSLPAVDTIKLLGEAVERGGIPAASGPRFFGYVTGGTLPVAVAADWLVAAWDQTASLYNLSPAISVAEHVAGDWLVDLFGLPPGTSVGFPTGCTMAHLTALAAARNHLLGQRGWDVEKHGLREAPEIEVIAGAQHHMTIDLALRYLGFGSGRVRVVPVDERGRMRVDELARVLADCTSPPIVCAQIGDVNSGAIDPVGEICDLAHRYGAWVHVDGAFGLWAAASPSLRPLVEGVERADSWACDAHKWLNVPYDCGIVFVTRPDAHRAAMLNERAGYLPAERPGERDAIEWVPDFSRRARSLPVWAALRTLGKAGVADLVDRCCALTRRFAEQLAEIEGVELLNDVVLNQVMVRFGDDDAVTRDVIARVQASGECWFGGTVWYGRAAMRVSVVSWRTTEDDVDRSVKVIRTAVAAAAGAELDRRAG